MLRVALAAAALLVAAIAGYYALAGWALSVALADAAEQAHERLVHGWRWTMSHPSDLVAGRPVGMRGAVDDGWLSGSSDGSGYLSLNFRGEKLDATLFARLRLTLELDRPASLGLYHREWLQGPVLAAPPVPLAVGRQTLSLDLAALDWTATRYGEHGQPLGTPVPANWGGETGTVASLRMHLLATPAVDYRIDTIAIEPAAPGLPVAVNLPLPEDLTLLPRVPQIPAPVFAQPPERLLAERRRVEQLRPAAIWIPTPALPALPGWVPPTLTVVLALVASRRRPGLSLLAFCTAAGWLLSLPPGWSWGHGIAAALLVRLGWSLHRSGRPLAVTAGAMRAAWLTVAAVVLVMAAPAVLLGDGGGTSAAGLAARLAFYLPWALLQQLVLQRLLVPALGGHGQPLALVGGAVLFGLLHWPNLALMVATLALGLLASLLYRHHGRLLPLAVLHAMLGTLYLELLPREWLWSGAVGWRYFQ